MDILLRLERIAGTQLFYRSEWAYPIVEIAHLMGLAILVGASAMFDLRLLGFTRQVPVSGMARHLLPWTRVGGGLAAITGLLLFSINASVLVSNRAFQLKVFLIALAGLNVLAFHLGPFRKVTEWDSHKAVPLRGRVTAFLSLVLWSVIIACGRLIAYVS